MGKNLVWFVLLVPNLQALDESSYSLTRATIGFVSLQKRKTQIAKNITTRSG
jgi:hypothetical protein